MWRQIFAELQSLNRKVDRLMSEQAHLDSTVAALSEQVTALTAAAANIADELVALKAQPGATALDFTGLDGVVAKLGSATAAVVADESPVTPAPVTPAP